MGTSQKKRQKKLEKRAAKQKQERKQLQREKSLGLAQRLARAASAPILDCCTTPALWDKGMSNVLISRQLTSSKVAFAMFLVDIYCLGVKDVFGQICSHGEYRQMYRQFAEKNEIVPLQSADARKLVEGAVDYAASIGLRPHRDYQKFKNIFGDIDPNKASEVFLYGHEHGRPHFIAGPHDTVARCQQIAETLERTCGPDGYDCTLPLHSGVFDDVTLDEETDEEIYIESDEEARGNV